MLTITFGVGNSVSKPEDSYRSVGQVLNDTSIQTVLNFDPSQVEARVSGQVVDPGTGIHNGMRIDLIKKAGKKEAEGFMNSDQQLRPLPVNSETLRVAQSHGAAALQPVYDEFSAAEDTIRKEVTKAQLELLKTCKPFAEYLDAIATAVVNRQYVDTELQIPQAVRDELEAVSKAGEEKILPLRKAVAKAEAAVSVWNRAVEADLKMCITLGEQRTVLAKALKSNPLEAWSFEAVVTNATPVA